MISSTQAASPVAIGLDSKGKPPAPLQQRPSFTRPERPADTSSASKIYNMNNPAHVTIKSKNEHLALASAAHMRALKTLSGMRGSCLFSFGLHGEGRGLLNGTSNHHTVRFTDPRNSSVTIKNGEITSVHGKISPMTLNSNLSFLVAALSAPGAEKNLRKNG